MCIKISPFSIPIKALCVLKICHFQNQLKPQNNKTCLEMFSFRLVIGKLKCKQNELVKGRGWAFVANHFWQGVRREREQFSWQYSPRCVFWDSSAKAPASSTNMVIQLFIQHVPIKNHFPWQSWCKKRALLRGTLTSQMEWVFDSGLSLQTTDKLDFFLFTPKICLFPLFHKLFPRCR